MNFKEYIKGAALLVALLVCTQVFANNSKKINPPTTTQHVIVTKRPLGALTDEAFDQNTLEILEEYVKGSEQKKVKKYTGAIHPLKTSSIFMYPQGKKLALINAEASGDEGKVYIKVFVGIKDSEFILIQCTDKKEISLASGACTNKVQEIFNIDLNE